FISKVKLGFLNQSGLFSNTNSASGSMVPGASNFWLLDTEIGYRLPQRYGIISLGIKNLLNEKYNFQAIDANQPSLPQGRFLFSRVTLSF
ncbi:MAG: hypothetical protein ABL925_12645, partial [Methylococcales bacterium]